MCDMKDWSRKSKRGLKIALWKYITVFSQNTDLVHAVTSSLLGLVVLLHSSWSHLYLEKNTNKLG